MIKSELSDVALLKSEGFYNHETEQVFTNIALHLPFSPSLSIQPAYSLPAVFANFL